MRNLSQSGYSHDTVMKMLKGNRKIRFRNELTDKNGIYLGDVTASGTISCDSRADIGRAASLTINEIKDINYIDERIKCFMEASTPRGWLKYPLGVFLISSPNRQNNGYRTMRDVECYDQSVILQEDKFTSRYYIPEGTIYTDVVTTIINGSGIINTRITSSDKTLSTDIEFEIGTSKLDAVNKLLSAINYNRLWFDADGNACSEPYVLPAIRTVEETYETNEESIIRPGVTESLDIFNCPNVIVRYVENPDVGELKSTYINDNPESVLSTVNRGRNIVDIESVSDIADQATLNSYVQRVAVEKSVYGTLTFNTATMPHHDILNCLMINNKDIGINEKYIELAWELPIEVGGQMKHVCRKVVPL